jgi:hypothetical protein
MWALRPTESYVNSEDGVSMSLRNVSIMYLFTRCHKPEHKILREIQTYIKPYFRGPFWNIAVRHWVCVDQNLDTVKHGSSTHGHICELHVYYKNHTTTEAARCTTFCYFFTWETRTAISHIKFGRLCGEGSLLDNSRWT